MARSGVENAIGQGLLAIGLFTVAFESMLLEFRAKMHAYVRRADPENELAFLKSCKTAFGTFSYCGSKLVQLGILADSDLETLSNLRERRNAFTHRGFDYLLALRVRDLEQDLQVLQSIAAKVEQWRPATSDGFEQDEEVQFSISPAIGYRFAKVVAERLADEVLTV